MTGDGHVPFRGSLGVKFPGATRLGRVEPDVVVVDERVVLLDVRGRVADEAGRGHRLLVRLPGAAGRLDPVDRDVRCVHEAGRTVAGDAERVAAGDGEIVRQARVADREVVGRDTVLADELVDVRCLAVADDLVVRVVLHQDREDVVERRYGRGRRSRCGVCPCGARQRRHQYECEGAADCAHGSHHGNLLSRAGAGTPAVAGCRYL